MGEKLGDDGAIEMLQDELRDILPPPRVRTGWALTLHLTKQVKLQCVSWGPSVYTMCYGFNYVASGGLCK